MGGPLAGIRVLDLSRVLAGPWATQNLADLGAEVIKIERPGSGDDTRAWGPPYLKDRGGEDTAESVYYLACNRGKRSVTLDFTKPEGLAIARALAEKSDILIENFKVGGLARHGLGYDDLKPDHPRLIYCSITGFGQTGPYRHRAGYDYSIQAMGGLMSVTGQPDGAPGAGPMRVGVAVADLMAGMYALSAVLAALHHRERTGEGQYIDLALFDVQAAFLANQAMNALIGGAAPGRIGNRHPNIVPYQCFAVSDGDLVVAVGTDPQFARLCALARAARSRSGPALRHQRCPRPPPRASDRHTHADLPRAGTQGMARRARASADSVRADQYHRRGVRRSADPRPRHAHRTPSPVGRDGADGGEPGEVQRHARRRQNRAAAPWRAHRRSARRPAWHVRASDRRPARGRRGLATAVYRPREHIGHACRKHC